MRARRLSSWWGALGLLVAIRLALPLAAYADSGSKLPGMPRWTYAGLQGDATGFYAAAREFMAAWGRVPRPLLALVGVAAVAAAVAIVLAWRRRPALRPWLVPLALFAFGLLICVDIRWQHFSGAAVFGWSLVWGLVMLPYRVLGFGISHHLGWWVGFVLSLVFVTLTVVAVGYLGRIRERSPLGRRPRRRLLDLLASARRPDRRPSRVGEQPVGRRRRAPPLRRAAVDAARHRRRGAAALPSAHADAALARRLCAQRRDGDEALQCAACSGSARRRLSARAEG